VLVQYEPGAARGAVRRAADVGLERSTRLSGVQVVKTIARKTVRPSSSGVLTLKLKRKLKKGRYKLTVVLRNASGGTRTLRQTVRR
jgi:hypothetical protein